MMAKAHLFFCLKVIDGREFFHRKGAKTQSGVKQLNIQNNPLLPP